MDGGICSGIRQLDGEGGGGTGLNLGGGSPYFLSVSRRVWVIKADDESRQVFMDQNRKADLVRLCPCPLACISHVERVYVICWGGG